MGKIHSYLIYTLILVALLGTTSCKKNKAVNSENNKSWVKSWIAKNSGKKGKSMPDQIVSYTYKNETVYLFKMPCCDQFNPIYDQDGKEICNTGGFTGKGDGKCNDFGEKQTTRMNGVVWQNEHAKSNSAD